MTAEVEEGSFFSESLVKQMTGGDPLSARPLYGAPFEFLPWFKLFVAGNHKPVIRGGDEGIWRRIDMIPFVVTVPSERRDPELAANLRGEFPGILNWALVGCRDWQKRRLDPPPAVVDAVAEYKEDMDILGQWVAEHCEIGPDYELFSSNAYSNYRFWADDAGLKRWSHVVFGRKLSERFAKRRDAKGVIYTGVGLKGATVGAHPGEVQGDRLRPPTCRLFAKADVLTDLRNSTIARCLRSRVVTHVDDKLELVGCSAESSAADSVQDRIGITGDMPFEVREQFRAPAGASGRAA